MLLLQLIDQADAPALRGDLQPVGADMADALVLPIFEGVEPILELKVIGRQLLGGGA